MTFWQWLDNAGQRRAALKHAKLGQPGLIERILPVEFRGWLALALFIQTSSLFGMMAVIRELTENQGFLTLASAVIVTGWIGGAAAFAYAAGKNNAERNETIDRLTRVVENAQPATAKPDVTLEPGQTATVAAEGDEA